MPHMRTMADLELDQALELLENVNVGFLVLTPQWTCAYANSEAERMVGLPRAELVGGRLTTLFPAIQSCGKDRQTSDDR